MAAPAEGVYGDCCDPFSETALCKLMDIKQRSTRKGLIVLIQHERQLGAVCDPLGKVEREAVTTYWVDGQPPTTLILAAKQGLSQLLTGGRDTLAVRCARAGHMQEYLAAWGHPLVQHQLK